MNTEQLLEERGKTHGDFSVHARCTQQLKEIMGAHQVLGLTDCQKEAIHMICHKLGRIAAGNPHEPDHWKDIAGYATLVAQRLT